MSEFLENRGFIIEECGARLLVCERDYEPEHRPEATVVLCYRPDKLGEFDECLKELTLCPTAGQSRELNRSIIMGKRGDCFEIVKIDDVFAFESIDDDTFCHTGSGRFGIKPKLYELERAYAEKGFIRIGKPYIVNVTHIAEVVPWFSGKILLRMDNMKETLEVSRNYARQFKNFLGMP
jgi:DNA-binding LytR/AlgR family response regulator